MVNIYIHMYIVSESTYMVLALVRCGERSLLMRSGDRCSAHILLSMFVLHLFYICYIYFFYFLHLLLLVLLMRSGDRCSAPSPLSMFFSTFATFVTSATFVTFVTQNKIFNICCVVHWSVHRRAPSQYRYKSSRTNVLALSGPPASKPIITTPENPSYSPS